MKILSITIILAMAVSFSFAEAPVHLWGYTTKDHPLNYQAGINIQAESPQGNSPIVQGYWISGGKAQYHIDGNDLVEGWTYTRVHGWTDTAEGEAPGFYWSGDDKIQRDVTVYTIAK